MSLEKRFSIFLIITLLILALNAAITIWMQPQQVAQGPGAAQAEKKPSDKKPGDKPAEKKPAEVGKPAEIGAADKKPDSEKSDAEKPATEKPDAEKPAKPDEG